MANLDFVMADGAVHDPQRIDYLRRYLRGLRRCCKDGKERPGNMMEIDSIRLNHWELRTEIAARGVLAKGELPDQVITDDVNPKLAFSWTCGHAGAVLTEVRIRLEAGTWEGWKEKTPEIRKIHGAVLDQMAIGCRMQELGFGPLMPFMRYRIQITAENNAGETVEAAADFGTGRMGTPWKAQWISDGTYHCKRPDSPVPMVFRRRFSLRDDSAAKLLLSVTAMGILDLALDGERIWNGYFAPGFTDYDHQLQYELIPLDGPFAPGGHELTVTVAAGWACGRSTHIANTNKSSSCLDARRQALLLELRIAYADGSLVVLGSDAQFEVSEEGPCRFADFYDGESYDAGREGLGKAAGFHPASRERLRVHPKISVQSCPPVRKIAVEKPVSCRKLSSGELLYDFGTNMAGVISFTVNGRAGQRILFRHGEAVTGEGKDRALYTANLRSAKQEVLYICLGGRQSFSPRFTYMGFRYVTVEGVQEEELTLERFVLSSALPEQGKFYCSDDRLNRLQENINRSARSNFIEIPTDCPQRDERQGWTGDIALFAETAAWNLDCTAFLRKWLRDLSAEQSFLGSIPFVVPRRRGITPRITTSVWGDACILVPWALYQETGDTEILREMYPAMRRFLADERRWAALSVFRWHSPYVLALPFQFGDWCAPEGTVKDWLRRGPWTGTAYFAYSCGLMAQIATVLGHAEEAAAYQALRKKTAHAYRTALLSEPAERQKKTEQKAARHKKDGQKMAGLFQTAYALPAAFHLLRPDQNRTCADALTEQIRKDGGHLSIGFPTAPFVLPALFDHGHEDEAYRLLMDPTGPSWLYGVEHGATSVWEQWQAIEEDGTIRGASLNHYAYGAVGSFFYRSICGLEPLVPGFRRFRVRPVPGGGLTYAECSHRTPYGVIRVRWDLDADGRLHAAVHVPFGSVCSLILPGRGEELLRGGQYERVCEVSEEEKGTKASQKEA